MEKFKKLIAVVLSVAILISTLIIGGAMATDTVADNDYTGVESELLSETFVFDFDKVRNYAVNSDYVIDQEGNLFYPLHSASDDTTVKQKNFTVDGETVTTVEVSAGGKTVFIPTDENGQPYIIEPNTYYSVRVNYYTMAAIGHGQFFMGGGTLASNEQACKTSAMDKNFYLWEEGKNKYTHTTGWNPFYRCTGIDWASDPRYIPEVSFTTESNSFRTLDFSTTGGMFEQSTYKNTGTSDAPVYESNEEYYDFGNYFGIFFSAGNVSVDGYNGNATYYIDSIEISRARTLKTGESYTFNFSEGEVMDVTANKTASVDGDGNTFYPFHAADTTGISSAKQENITVKTDDKGGTETIGTLKFVNNGNTSYIPTDKNGVPLVIEPNSKYKVSITSYAQYVSKEGQFFAGGGIYEANKADYNPLYAKSNNDNTWYYVDGTNNGAAAGKIYTVYPIFNVGGFNYNSKNGNMYVKQSTSDSTKLRYYSDFDKTNSAQYQANKEYTFLTSDFSEITNEQFGTGTNSFNTDLWQWYRYTQANGKDYSLGITDPYSDLAKQNNVVIENKNIGTYFGIHGGGGKVTGYYDDGSGTRVATDPAYTTYYIDSITVTKVSPAESTTAAVTLDANGGTFEEGTTLSADLTIGAAPSATLPTNADETLSFAGWSTHKNGDVITTVTSDLFGKTLYAIWKPAVANVTFNANGGTLAGGGETKTATQFEGLKLTEANPSRDGYIFMGWGKTADASTPEILASADLANTTLYALWAIAPTPISVYFNANGGVFSDGSRELLSEQFVGSALSVDTPAYNNNKFLGWATDIDGTSTVNTVTKDMEGDVLYAVWKYCHPVDGNYDSWSRTVEFDKYVVTSSNSFKPTPSETADYGEYNNKWYFDPIDDPDEEGDKYLHYYNYSAASRWAANWSITPTPTGVTNTNSDAESGQVLPTGSTFRMTFRVRINSTGGGSPVIAMFYGTTSGRNSITDNETKTPNEILKTGLTASDEWQDIEVYFTTPDEYPTLTKGVANRFYTGIISGSSNKGYKLKYDLDYIKIEKVTNVNFYVKEDGKYVLKESLEGCPGETLDLPDAYSVENYSPYDPTGNYTMMAYKNWFADENLTSVPTLKFGNLDQNLYCGGATEMPEVSVDNQEIFVGFDTYTQRTDGLVNATVTDSDAYTGSASLKAEGNALFELKNDHTLDVENGKTYRVDFAYKADKNATLFMGLAECSVENGIVNKGYADLTATDDWRSASIVFTADGALENSVLGGSVSTADDATVFIDTVIVSSATESVGVEAETADDGEALRFMLTYSGNDLVMAGENYTVTEHGVLVKGAELDTELSLDNADEAGIFAFSQTDVSQNWSVNPITGAIVYSAYLNGFEKNDDYKVSVRGYVKLSDGTVYYSDILTASVADIPAARDVIPEDADLSAYYVFLPEGTTLPADADYTVTTYDDTFKANNAVEGNLITKDSYVLFSARPDFSKIDVPSELKYLVHGGTKDELYYGIEAQIVSEKISEVGSDTVNYLFITDIHFSSTDKTSLLKQAALMAKMANENDDIDFIVIGGDTTTGMFDSKEACVTATQTALDPFLASTKPVFVLMGNHDDNSYHLLSGSNTNDELYEERVITDLDWQNNIINRYTNRNGITVVQDSKRENSKYYYYDLEDKKTRVIALDALDYEAKYDENGYVLGDLNDDGLLDGMPVKDANGATDHAKYYSGCSYWGYSADQIRWLAEDALGELPADYDVIFVSHMGIDITTNAYGSKIWFGENIREVIKAFNEGGSYTASLTDLWGNAVSVNASFAGKNGDLLSWQFGHQHVEISLYESDVDLWQFCTLSASVAQSKIQTEDDIIGSYINREDLPWRAYLRTRGTKNEACFNAMSVSPERVYRFAVGQGNNEKLIYPS